MFDQVLNESPLKTNIQNGSTEPSVNILTESRNKGHSVKKKIVCLPKGIHQTPQKVPNRPLKKLMLGFLQSKRLVLSKNEAYRIKSLYSDRT